MTTCSCPEDGLRCRKGIKPPLKLKLLQTLVIKVKPNPTFKCPLVHRKYQTKIVFNSVFVQTYPSNPCTNIFSQ